MEENRYLPNSQLEPVDNYENIFDLIETQMYTYCTELNKEAQHQSHSTVYCGIAGVLYMNLILYEHNKSEEFLKKGKEIVALLKRSKFRHMTSFLEGSSGFHSLVSMLYFYLNKETTNEKDVNSASLKEANVLINYFFNRKEELLHIDNDQNELLYGKCGLIYSFLFCKSAWIASKEHRRNILSILYFLTNSIIDNGRKYSPLNYKRVPLSLYYEWHGSVYLGAAHGYAGILFILFKTVVFISEYFEDTYDGILDERISEKGGTTRDQLKTELFEYMKLIYKVADEILMLYVTSEYNVYSSVKREKIEKKKTEKLVQWCHGNPGYIILLIELLNKENIKKLEKLDNKDHLRDLSNAQNIFHEKYNFLIEKMGQLLWNKGLLIKGFGLCHGIAGNGIIFLYIYNYTKDKIWYTRALQYGLFCIKNFKKFYDVPDRPDSLFEGYAGLVVFLSFLLKPELTYFPAHDFSKI